MSNPLYVAAPLAVMVGLSLSFFLYKRHTQRRKFDEFRRGLGIDDELWQSLRKQEAEDLIAEKLRERELEAEEKASQTGLKKGRFVLKIHVRNPVEFPIDGEGVLEINPGSLTLSMELDTYGDESSLYFLDCKTWICDQQGREWECESSVQTEYWAEDLEDFADLDLTLWDRCPHTWRDAMSTNCKAAGVHSLGSYAPEELAIGGRIYQPRISILLDQPKFDLAYLLAENRWLIRIRKLSSQEPNEESRSEIPAFAWTVEPEAWTLPTRPERHFFSGQSGPLQESAEAAGHFPKFTPTGRTGPAQSSVRLFPDRKFAAPKYKAKLFPSIYRESTLEQCRDILRQVCGSDEPEELLACLNKNLSRKELAAALTLALNRPSPLFAEKAKSLTAHPYPEVRLKSLRLYSDLEKEKGEELYLSALTSDTFIEKSLPLRLACKYGSVSSVPAVAEQGRVLLRHGSNEVRDNGESDLTLVLQFLEKHQDQSAAARLLQEVRDYWDDLTVRERAWLLDQVKYTRRFDDQSECLFRPALEVMVEANHPVFQACRTGDLATIEKFLNDGGSVYSAAKDQPPLVAQAIGSNQLEVVKLLYERGLHLNRATRGFQEPPLVLALQNKNEEIVKYLLAHGANPNRTGENHRSILFQFCQTDIDPKWIQLMLGHDADLETEIHGIETVFGCAAAAENIPLMELFLSKGLDPNWQNYYGETPLIIAARLGKVKSAQWLLDHGANSKVEDKNGLTALQWARDKNHAEVVAVLKGAK